MVDIFRQLRERTLRIQDGALSNNQQRTSRSTEPLTRREFNFLMTIPTLTRSRSLAPGQGSCVLERWSKKMKLNVRRFLKRGAIVIAALATPVVAFFGLWFASSAGSDRGSPKLASEWSLQLSEFTDPDAAVASNERVWVIHDVQICTGD